MNFLAHIYLSDNNDFIKIGNFMADGIRGKDYLDYPEQIKKGIILHRAIDTYTDANKTFRISKHRLHKRYGHYSGVIVDILYDHFLAKNWAKYSDESLHSFVFRFYQSLEDNFETLTPKTQRILPIMIEQNWLESYATIEGISKILFQMDYRTKFKSKMQFSVEELEAFYDEFENEFTLFFEELRNHVDEKLVELKIV
jgi:acyl carrier protein phosphodiesterase